MSATGGKGTRPGRRTPNQPPGSGVFPTVTTWTDRTGLSSRFVFGCVQLLRFGWLEVVSCLFPAFLFAGLAVSKYVDLPIARYDALLLYCLVLTLLFWLVRLETWREVAVIFGFHLVGLGLELFKVHVGSWQYPGDAVTKFAGVPLFAGFMYAAVGSYLCQAWRRFDLRVSGYRPLQTTVFAVLIYLNFFTHHWLPDLRIPIAIGLLVVLRRAWVFFTVGVRRYRMPLAVSFALIGFFLWIAENAGTFLDAWNYPDQVSVWRIVHPEKFGAWSLLVSMSFVLVASVKSLEGRLYHRGTAATVEISPQHDRANQADG
ncbi:DUF817 domain-containing protein [Kribbella solani]|uniref:Uncharacterized membrane protein YoaT (DUF817 family) n=1 Tax=Kribbella solani TaxID=236067 RepID=A0A841E355_9ACTN|nr:uncharacterized membrane protein YoaT (DUF817 family) [Kribbella solani]